MVPGEPAERAVPACDRGVARDRRPRARLQRCTGVTHVGPRFAPLDEIVASLFGVRFSDAALSVVASPLNLEFLLGAAVGPAVAAGALIFAGAVRSELRIRLIGSLALARLGDASYTL
jgi:peptidoglycan/LPS O-acetylase OafA/YrhL